MAGGLKGDGREEFKGLRITSLDDDSDEEEEQQQKEQDIVIDEDDEEEEDDEARNSVVLGFVKKPKKACSLLRHFFPSKAGGVPAWLDPENLPSGRSCFCDICSEPLQYVLQLYAPEEKQSAFHRTLFVFMCTSMVCLRRDQHEQWKCHQDKPSRRFSAANYPVIILSTQVSHQRRIVRRSLLRLELHSVIGVVSGKGLNAVLVAEEHVIA